MIFARIVQQWCSSGSKRSNAQSTEIWQAVRLVNGDVSIAEVVWFCVCVCVCVCEQWFGRHL